ncbi:hypothetical protein [Bradyrhizobium sp. 5.13L]
MHSSEVLGEVRFSEAKRGILAIGLSKADVMRFLQADGVFILCTTARCAGSELPLAKLVGAGVKPDTIFGRQNAQTPKLLSKIKSDSLP